MFIYILVYSTRRDRPDVLNTMLLSSGRSGFLFRIAVGKEPKLAAHAKQNVHLYFSLQHVQGQTWRFTKRVSKHGLRLAVDINPLYNQYIKEVDDETIIEPVISGAYTDRNADINYKINENDLAYKLFTEHRFEWGRSWQELKDYQLFEIPTPVIEKLYKQN